MRIICLLLLVFPSIVFSQEAGILGKWVGSIVENGAEMSVIFKVRKVNGNLQSTMDSPNENVYGIAVKNTTFASGEVHFDLSDYGISYKGNLQENGTIKGTLQQGLAKVPLDLEQKPDAELQKLIDADRKKEEQKEKEKQKKKEEEQKIQETIEKEREQRQLETQVKASSKNRAIVGTWRGTYVTGHEPRDVVFYISEKDGKLQVFWDTFAPQINIIKTQKVIFENEHLKCKAPEVLTEISADIQKDGSLYTALVIDQKLYYSSMKRDLRKIQPTPVNNPPANNLPVKTNLKAEAIGTWSGILDVGNAKLRIVFHISEGSNGELNGKMDSPDQNAYGIPTGKITIEKDEVVIDMTNIGAEYRSKIDGNSMSGDFKQSGYTFLLTLERSEK